MAYNHGLGFIRDISSEETNRSHMLLKFPACMVSPKKCPSTNHRNVDPGELKDYIGSVLRHSHIEIINSQGLCPQNGPT